MWKTRADSAAAGHFSVSVIDESKVPADENNEGTILTNMLFTSDLKGYVEQPNYYFTDITAGKLKDLDLVYADSRLPQVRLEAGI